MSVGDEVEVVEPNELDRREGSICVRDGVPAFTQMGAARAEVAIEVAGTCDGADDGGERELLAAQVDLAVAPERTQRLIEQQ